MLLQFVDDQGISVFEGIFSSTLKVPSYLRPLFESLVVLDELEQFGVLVGLPWPLFQVGAKIASPMLPALLGVSIYFILILI